MKSYQKVSLKIKNPKEDANVDPKVDAKGGPKVDPKVDPKVGSKVDPKVHVSRAVSTVYQAIPPSIIPFLREVAIIISGVVLPLIDQGRVQIR